MIAPARTAALRAWQQRNGEATIPHCIEQLEVSGVLDNFRRLLGESDAEFRGFVFADSDLYKVIEGVAWEIARTGTRASHRRSSSRRSSGRTRCTSPGTSSRRPSHWCAPP